MLTEKAKENDYSSRSEWLKDVVTQIAYQQYELPSEIRWQNSVNSFEQALISLTEMLMVNVEIGLLKSPLEEKGSEQD